MFRDTVAVLMANSLSNDDTTANGTEGEPLVTQGQPGAEGTAVTPFFAEPPRCRDDDGFRVVSTGIEVGEECCQAAVIGELENTCDKPLKGEVEGIFRNSRGTILTLGNESHQIERLGPGERAVFRIDFSTRIGWELAQQRGVRPRFIVRSDVTI